MMTTTTTNYDLLESGLGHVFTGCLSSSPETPFLPLDRSAPPRLPGLTQGVKAYAAVYLPPTPA